MRKDRSKAKAGYFKPQLAASSAPPVIPITDARNGFADHVEHFVRDLIY